MRRSGLAALLVLFWSGAVGAEPRFPEWVRFEQRPGQQSALRGVVDDFPLQRSDALAAAGHPYVDVVRRNELEIQSEGLLRERITLVRRLLTSAGVHDHGNLSLPVRSQLAHTSIEEAWVQRPDGRIVDFDPQTLQIVAGAAQDVFSDIQFLVFAFSGLEPGSTLVLSAREDVDLERWPLTWSRIYTPQTLQPTESFEVYALWKDGEVAAPRWASDDPELRCNEGHGVLTCSRRRIPAIPADPDVDWQDRLPQLVVGAAESWAELAGRERQLVKQASARDENLAGVADELALDRGSDRKRLERIHRFVADRVRYVAFEHGSNAVVPHPASLTLSRRYGDCKDKVALFLALARRAGLQAYPVLVASSRYAAGKLLLPSWRYFDHMIACVDEDRGKRTCVDLTDPYSGTGQLPLAIAGAVSLDLREAVEAPSTLASPPQAWRIEVATMNEVGCDGSISEHLTRRFVGPGAAAVRAQLAGLSASDRQRWLEEDYAEVAGEGRNPVFEVRGMDESGADLTLESRTRFGGNGPLAKARFWSGYDGWLVHYARSFQTQNRHHPYRMKGIHLRTRNSYRLCADTQVRFEGARLDLRSPVGSLERRYDLSSDGVLAVVTDLRLPLREVPVDELEAFNRFLERTLAQTRIWFSIEPKPEGGS